MLLPDLHIGFSRAGQMVLYSHLFQNFPQFIVIRIVNKAEIDVFLELSCFFHDPVDVGSLISGPLVAVAAGAAAVQHWNGGCASLERQ